jgi:hypothetical protein
MEASSTLAPGCSTFVPADAWFKIVYLLRFVAFMVLVYLTLGWLVERWSRKPDSRLKDFFRLLCSPVTRPVARRMPKGTTYQRVLGVSLGIAAGFWVAFSILYRALA